MEGTYSQKVKVISCHLFTGWPLATPGEEDVVIVKPTSWEAGGLESGGAGLAC